MAAMQFTAAFTAEVVGLLLANLEAQQCLFHRRLGKKFRHR